jgi:hypothetical protein
LGLLIKSAITNGRKSSLINLKYPSPLALTVDIDIDVAKMEWLLSAEQKLISTGGSHQINQKLSGHQNSRRGAYCNCISGERDRKRERTHTTLTGIYSIKEKDNMSIV